MSKDKKAELTSKYDQLFKNLLTKESSYEFYLKAQSSLKRTLQRNPNSIEFLSLLNYSINHLKKFDENESINSLLNYSLEQFTQKHKKIPEEIPKQKFISGFMDAFSLSPGLANTDNFRMKFLFYCKKNDIDEKTLRLYKCYDVFAQESMRAKDFNDAYKYCIKSENINLLFELFDMFENFMNDKKILDEINSNPFNRNKSLFTELDKEEFDMLILRTSLELLIKKKVDLAFEFVGKFYKKYNEEKDNDNKSIIINFSYVLVCLLIREPKGFDHFWAIINMYKGIIEKQYDIQFYLNKISVVYYNKPFLKEK
jgi:hypothetical protein